VLRFAITEDFRPSCGPTGGTQHPFRHCTPTGGTKAWGPHVSSAPNPKSRHQPSRNSPIQVSNRARRSAPASRRRPPLPPPHCSWSAPSARRRPPLPPPLGPVPARLQQLGPERLLACGRSSAGLARAAAARAPAGLLQLERVEQAAAVPVPARSSLTDRGRPPLLPPLGPVPARRAPTAGRPRAPAAGLRCRRRSAPAASSSAGLLQLPDRPRPASAPTAARSGPRASKAAAASALLPPQTERRKASASSPRPCSATVHRRGLRRRALPFTLLHRGRTRFGTGLPRARRRSPLTCCPPPPVLV